MDRNDPRLARLKDLVEEKAVLWGEFILSSGAKSRYYFDGRRVTHDPEGIALIGALVGEIVQEAGVEAIGGPTVGANPMVTAAQLACHEKGYPLQGFFVRPQQKEHGTERRIEGNLPARAGAPVAIVDDTLTSGGSILGAIEAVEAEGCRVAKVLVLVDRRQGGSERLRQKGYDVHALFEADAEGRIAVSVDEAP